MNETRTFLLRMMGEAQSLEEFWQAYRALQNLTRLVFLAQQATPTNFAPAPQPGLRFRQSQPPQEQTPGEETSWERMPWEGGE